MAKLSKTIVGKDTIEEYLTTYSDFSFEINVLKELKYYGFLVEHSGTYKDPITNKYREFDIRAKKRRSEFICRLAVECKNIRENFPLVAHCFKRNRNECFHQYILNHPEGSKKSSFHSLVKNMNYHSSIYKEGEFVAKSLDQVGRQLSDNSIINNDGLLFDKVSQAINSCYDLITQSKKDNYDDSTKTFVLPILVIPDGRLWKIKYDDEGNIDDSIEQVDHVSYFVNVPFIPEDKSLVEFRVSHLEIITLSHLKIFTEKYFDKYEAMEEIFLE